MKMAYDPTLIQKDLTLESLAAKMRHSYRPMEKRRNTHKMSLASQVKRRKISCCKEFKLLCGRSAVLTLRNPVGFIAVLVMAVINSFMLSSLFGGIATKELKRPVLPTNKGFDRKDPYFTAYN